MVFGRPGQQTWYNVNVPYVPDLAELREKHSWGTLTRKTEKPRARDPRRAALGIPEKRTRRKRRVRANGPLTSPDLASGQWPRRIHSGLKS